MFANGQPSAILPVTMVSAPDCSQTIPTVNYVYSTSSVGVNLTWST